MEQNANAEKQARYRKKEQLKRHADNLLLKWQGDRHFAQHKKSIQDVQHLIAKAIELPSGWTDEDYQIAEIKLIHVQTELQMAVDQITNDLHESSNYSAKFMTVPDPSKLHADFDKAVEKTNSLASHFISAIKLSECNEAEQAAALIEALRFVGRSMVLNHREIPYSDAAAVCLATIGPHYVRPDWFAEKLASTLSKQIDQKLSDEVGKHLIK